MTTASALANARAVRFVVAAVIAVVCAIGCAVGCTNTAVSGGAGAPAPTPNPPASSSSAPTRAAKGEPQVGLPRGVVILQGAGPAHRFDVQVAATPRQREKGLMFVEHLDDDAGMIFFFDRSEPLSFWMKNTLIPLDMLFIDENLVVKGIVENAEPLTTTPRRIAGATRFVLELNGGTSRRLGLAPGDRVSFEGISDALWRPAPARASSTTTNHSPEEP
jgi:uncharacterized membrane protein (UPF0127 family)